MSQLRRDLAGSGRLGFRSASETRAHTCPSKQLLKLQRRHNVFSLSQLRGAAGASVMLLSGVGKVERIDRTQLGMWDEGPIERPDFLDAVFLADCGNLAVEYTEALGLPCREQGS